MKTGTGASSPGSPPASSLDAAIEDPSEPVATRPSHKRRPTSSVPLVILAVLAVGYTFVIARPVLMPIVFAWLGKLAFSPIVKRAQRRGISTTLTAVLIVTSVTAVATVSVYELSGPATRWAQRLPEDIRKIRDMIEFRFGGVGSSLATVSKAREAVSELTEDTTPTAKKPVEVAVVNRQPSADLLDGLWNFGANLVVGLVLFFFMLSTGDTFLIKVVESVPRLTDAKAAVATIRGIEASVARYLSTVTVINLVLGVCVGIVCWLFELENALLWGAMAAVFNFVPYVGALAGCGIVAVVGITSLNSLGAGVTPAAIYLGLNALEGMIVTPLIIGRRLAVSPVILFMWLLLLSWLWGIAGALIAVPLLVVVKIICDHIPRFAPIGRFLGA